MMDGEVVLRIHPIAGAIKVETNHNGVISYKEITSETLTECLRGAIRHPTFSSGLLPQGCISFFAGSNDERVISILHPERYADITYYKTLYKHFPLPRLVFQFSLYQGLRVNNASVGIVAEGRLRPETKMFRWPFSNVSGFRMCIGNNVMPKCESLHTLSSLPYLILQIPNNDDHYSLENNQMKMEYRELLEHLKDKAPSYYYDKVLVPWNKTLIDFIRSN